MKRVRRLRLAREVVRELGAKDLRLVDGGFTGTVAACPKSKDTLCTVAAGDGGGCCE